MDYEKISESEYVKGSGMKANVEIPFQYKYRKGNWGGGIIRKKTKYPLKKFVEKLINERPNNGYKRIVNSIVKNEEGHRKKDGSFGKFPEASVKEIKADEEEWRGFREFMRKIYEMHRKKHR